MNSKEKKIYGAFCSLSSHRGPRLVHKSSSPPHVTFRLYSISLSKVYFFKVQTLKSYGKVNLDKFWYFEIYFKCSVYIIVADKEHTFQMSDKELSPREIMISIYFYILLLLYSHLN